MDQRERSILDYHAREGRSTWLANPCSMAGAFGAFIGLFVPPAIVLWDRWLDGVTRVPRLWYQQAWLEPTVILGLMLAICVGSRWRFGAGLLLGVLAAGGILTINAIVEAEFRRGVLLAGSWCGRRSGPMVWVVADGR